MCCIMTIETPKSSDGSCRNCVNFDPTKAFFTPRTDTKSQITTYYPNSIQDIYRLIVSGELSCAINSTIWSIAIARLKGGNISSFRISINPQVVSINEECGGFDPYDKGQVVQGNKLLPKPKDNIDLQPNQQFGTVIVEWSGAEESDYDGEFMGTPDYAGE